MLVDLHEVFNYYQDTMPDGAAPGGPGPEGAVPPPEPVTPAVDAGGADGAPKTEAETKPERVGRRRAQEIGWVASALFNRDRDRSPELQSADLLRRATAESAGNLNADLASGAGEIRFFIDHPDKGFIEVSMREIADASNPDTMTFVYSEIDPDTGAVHPDKQAPITLDREDITIGLLVSERDKVIDSFSDPDEKAIVEAHLNLMDLRVLADDESDAMPKDTEDLRGQLERVAKGKLLTVDDMDQYLGRLVQNGICTREDAQPVYDALSGDIVISPDGVRELLKLGGLSAEGISDKIQALGEERKRLEALHQSQGSTPEGRDTKRQLDEIIATQALLEGTTKLLGTKDEQGRDPVDAFFDKAYAGEIDFDKIGDLIQAFREGDLSKVTEQLVAGIPLPEDLSPEDQKRIRDVMKRVVTSKGFKIGGGIAVGVPLGILAIIIAAMGAMAVTAMRGGGQ